MEQSDYLLRQIQMMAQVIAALIRKLTGLKELGTEEEITKITDETLVEYFDTSLSEIVQTPVEETVELFMQKNKLHPSNFDLFAEVLIINADKSENALTRKKMLERALVLLEWADRTGSVFSVERNQKIEDIRDMLEQL
jgi:hypothetical protein